MKTKRDITIPAIASAWMMLKYLLEAIPAKAVTDVSTSLIEFFASAFSAKDAYLFAARSL